MQYDPEDHWNDDDEAEKARKEKLEARRVIYMFVMTFMGILIVWTLAIKELKDIITGVTTITIPKWLTDIFR